MTTALDPHKVDVVADEPHQCTTILRHLHPTETLKTNDSTRAPLRHREHPHEMSIAVDVNHLPFASAVANAATLLEIAEVRLARRSRKQSILALLAHHQTEPPTAVAHADVTSDGETPSGEEVADPLPRKPIQG